MSLDNLVIRNFEKTDTEVFVEYYNKAHADYPGHEDLTVEMARQYIFDAPDYDAGSHFLALLDGRIVGSMKGGRFGNVGTLGMSVIPEHRFTGIEEALYTSVLDFFRSEKLTEMTAWIPSKFDRLMQFYLDKNFHVWKFSYDMKCDLSAELPALPEISGEYHIASPDYEKDKEGITRVIDEGFSDDMEDTAPLLQEFDRICGAEFFDETGTFVARKMSNDEIVGISVNVIHPARPETAWVPWLAVLKDDRRKGLGKVLLLTGLGWIKEKGPEKAKLTVDLETPHAIKLYKDCGFEVTAETKILKGGVPE